MRPRPAGLCRPPAPQGPRGHRRSRRRDTGGCGRPAPLVLLRSEQLGNNARKPMTEPGFSGEWGVRSGGGGLCLFSTDPSTGLPLRGWNAVMTLEPW